MVHIFISIGGLVVIFVVFHPKIYKRNTFFMESRMVRSICPIIPTCTGRIMAEPKLDFGILGTLFKNLPELWVMASTGRKNFILFAPADHIHIDVQKDIFKRKWEISYQRPSALQSHFLRIKGCK